MTTLYVKLKILKVAISKKKKTIYRRYNDLQCAFLATSSKYHSVVRVLGSFYGVTG